MPLLYAAALRAHHEPSPGSFHVVWKTAALIAGSACCLAVAALAVAGGLAFKAFGGFRPRGAHRETDDRG